MKGLARLLVACCIAAAASRTGAAPLCRSDLPADPAWLLHVDCDSLRQAYLGKYLLYYVEKPEMRSNVVAFQSIFNFDFRTQLHGVTVYGHSSTPNDGAVIIYADFDPAHLIALGKAAPEAGATTNNQHVIYGWLSADSGGARSYAAILTGRAVMSKSKEDVMTVLAAIDGTAPNYSAGKILPEPSATPDAPFVQAAARDLKFLGADPISSLMKMSKRATFQAVETNEQLEAVLTLEAGDESAARQMSLVAQGQVALLSLQRNNPKAAQLASGISVKQEGAVLKISLSIPSTDLVAALKAYDAAKKNPKPATE
ncbi:MAG TPA: hypothetical protein VGO59_19740 [Verrucomicrobiae bacterium]|jgi:hypothetical protein